jgi:CzcA family heavy metal efflux pump
MIAFTKFLERHARAIYLAFILFAAAGFLAFKNLASDVYPELSFPRIAIIAVSGDTSPERLLLTVTRILEEAASQVYKVRWVRSVTIRGSAELSVEFQHGTDMVFALHQLQARIAEAQSRLPQGTALTVELVTPAIFPVISYNVSSDALTQADLYTIARYQIQPALSRVSGVARVQIQGGDIPQVAVEVEASKLKSYGLSLSQVADAIKKTNQVQVVGRLDEAHEQNLVVASGEALNLSDLDNVVVATRPGNNPIFLKDIATIANGFADRTSVVSVEAHKGLVVNIFRQPNSNVLAVSRGVKQTLGEVKRTLPLGVSIKPAYDESALVKYAMANVCDAILLGVGLIIVILYLFLRSWRSTAIAALTIPLSALAAFAVLFALGQSLNLMSLGGLAVAIGLVIDDAIVVIENINRQLALTSDTTLATANALSELVGPVTSSTATTVVVFLPLGLLSGVAGQFFTSLTITLSAAVIFSWLLALTLTPMLAVQLLKQEKNKRGEGQGEGAAQVYGRFLAHVLKQPVLVLVSTILIIAGTTFFFSRLSSDFLPAVDEGSYVLDYLAPAGASLRDVDRLAQKLEAIVARTPEVATWTRRTGAELGLFATQTNKGDILVVLKPASQRKRVADQIMEAQRQEIRAAFPQLEVDFHQILQDQLNDLSGAPRPIEVRIFGEDPTVLKNLSGEVKAVIDSIKGTVDTLATCRQGAPEIDLNVDPARAGRLGLTPADVASQVQDALFGRIAAQLRRGDRLVDIRVRLSDKVRLDPELLAQLPIVGANGTLLPLDALASLNKKQGEREITCENQQRYVAVEANLEGRDLGSCVSELKQKLAPIALPVGYTLNIAGLYASQKEAFAELAGVFCLALVLVYLLLVVQFRSMTKPVAIFVAVPLALFGVVVALWITKTPLNVSSFMGIILLVGLVVKNGIILLEYAGRLLRQGLPEDEAIVKAGIIRLRPIVMTTLCTLLGLIPLAIGLGTGAELQRPLAIAVIGGLSLSTVFTLIFVPVIYKLIERQNKVASGPRKAVPEAKLTLD